MTGSPLWPREDVLPRRHAVLGGISPGYPSVTARLHTCYSPVRRSPAATSKLAAPLPLDLHVLSLSLAFILSQDQTLRCCYIVLLSFEIGWRPRGPLTTEATVSGPVYLLSRNRQEASLAPVLLRLLQFFQCPISCRFPACGGKALQSYVEFLNRPNFSAIFFSNFSTPGGVSIFWGRRGTSVPKSECKVTRFFRIDQIFRRLFFKLFFRRDGDGGRRRLEDRRLGDGRAIQGKTGRRGGMAGMRGARREGGAQGGHQGLTLPAVGHRTEGGRRGYFFKRGGFFDGNGVCCKFAARNFYEYFYYKHIKNENRED